MNAIRLLVVALLLTSTGVGLAAEPAPRLDPANTHAVIVGVLRWQDKSIATYSPRHRKDRELAELLRARGVPAGNIRLLLDDEATLANVQKGIRELAEKTTEKSTFIFYFAGHGHRVGDSVTLTNFDIDGGRDETGLKAKVVGTLLNKHLKGGRVMFFADCCHSGGLSVAAKVLADAKRPAVVVTSADQSCESTGNWTFSQTLIDCLRGDPLADRDGDGVVTLAELEQEVSSAMKHRENQRSGRTDLGVEPGFVLAPVSDKVAKVDGKFAVGDYVMAKRTGGETAARVVGRRDGKYVVQFYDYSDKKERVFTEGELRAFAFPATKVGQTVVNTLDGKKRSAKVLEVVDDFCRIRYKLKGLRDEWVLSSELTVPAEGVEIADDKVIEVEWKGQWYPAEILKEEKGRTRIHYVGYGPEWDEWVGPERMRTPK